MGVQEVVPVTSIGGSISATLGTTPSSSEWLVAVYSEGDNAAVLNTPSGWYAAVLASSNDNRATIFLRKGDGSVNSITVTTTETIGRKCLTLMRVSGLDNSLAAADLIDAIGSVPQAGGTSNPIVASGTTTRLGLAIVGLNTRATSGGFSNAWTNGFVRQAVLDAATTGTPASQQTVAAKDDIPSETTPSTTETWATSRVNAGVMVVLKKSLSRTDRRISGAFSTQTVERRESGLWVPKTVDLRQAGAWT